MSITARQWLEKIRALPLPSKVKIMNVCGGHERTITQAALRSALPVNIELVPMNAVDSNWRGIGVIPQSGYALNEAFAAHDARKHFTSYTDTARKRVGQMPQGCDCANVVLGKIYPNECRIYGNVCTPRDPIGPCMVSDEGACRIWWASGVRENVIFGTNSAEVV